MSSPAPGGPLRAPLDFLPRQLRPNRAPSSNDILPAAPPLRSTTQALSAALQQAVVENLAALLAQKPPAPLDVRAFAPLGVIAPDEPPPWWMRLWAWARTSLATLARRILHPHVAPPPPASGAADLLDPATARGGEILLPAIIEQALGDASFRLQLGERCRIFLEDRVLFHPGPAPAPVFSPGGTALLIASQPAHGRALGAAYDRLQQAARHLRGPGIVLGFWDQWLLRRMQEAPGWTLPDDLPPPPWPAAPTNHDSATIAPALQHSLMELMP